jgi:hypothetical protein
MKGNLIKLTHTKTVRVIASTIVSSWWALTPDDTDAKRTKLET